MITTPRLRLRRPELGDFEAYVAMWSHPDILVHMSSGSFTSEQMWARFLRQAGGWHYLGFGYFSIEERETKRFVGQIGFQDLRREISPSLEGSMEAGWTIHPQAQGLGYASEAARGLFDWGGREFRRAEGHLHHRAGERAFAADRRKDEDDGVCPQHLSGQAGGDVRAGVVRAWPARVACAAPSSALRAPSPRGGRRGSRARRSASRSKRNRHLGQ
ncbi:MAG: hypothetical protein CTR54_02715 [Rhizobium sp.]|nr:MAG: hypothetical protein CTR54_02715 [Rhizobium sp.]